MIKIIKAILSPLNEINKFIIKRIGKKKYKWLLFIGTCGILLFLSQPLIYKFLSRTKKTNANILVVEGWTSPYVVHMAYYEFRSGKYDAIVTTGVNAPEYFAVSMNGFLIFYTDGIFKNCTDSTFNKIQVQAYSEMDGEHCSHFNFYLNDSIYDDYCIGTDKQKYTITFNGRLSQLDSIMIEFDNDAWSRSYDHNLYVKQLIINDSIKINYKENALYDRMGRGWEKRIDINYTTFAGIARNRLIYFGINKDSIITVPGKMISNNRTFSSALSFKQWLEENKHDIEGINIVTEGAHARRTWVTYRKILDKNINVGIISIPQRNRYIQAKQTYIELVELFYYNFILFLYNFLGIIF